MTPEIRWHQVPDIDLRAILANEDHPAYAAALEEDMRRRELGGQPGQGRLKLDEEDRLED